MSKNERVASMTTDAAPSTIPSPTAHSSQSRPPVSRRSTWPAAGPKRRTPSKPRKKTTKIPTVRRSFVVEVLPHDESSAFVMARISPAESAALAAVENEFRFSDAFLDVISDLLVNLAREEEQNE
jgi:hypothetical protein